DWKKEIEKLEYFFYDPIKFDKKIDLNNLKFGSKVNTADGKTGVRREEYFFVKEIIKPNLIKLSNDLVIKLIGIKPIDGKQQEAINFLRNKILKRLIFLKYDYIKYDKENHLMAYVYMKNRTFINVHLLKHELCTLDSEFNFKHRIKFESVLKG
ncbi:unnamed protein product, partial [marine sediment metagenome]